MACWPRSSDGTSFVTEQWCDYPRNACRHAGPSQSGYQNSWWLVVANWWPMVFKWWLCFKFLYMFIIGTTTLRHLHYLLCNPNSRRGKKWQQTSSAGLKNTDPGLNALVLVAECPPKTNDASLYACVKDIIELYTVDTWNLQYMGIYVTCINNKKVYLALPIHPYQVMSLSKQVNVCFSLLMNILVQATRLCAGEF